jgi:hypothetical protein
MIALNTALEGTQRAESSFDAAARRISLTSDPQPADSASLSDNAVALLQSKNDVDTSLKVAHTADDMTKTALKMLA